MKKKYKIKICTQKKKRNILRRRKLKGKIKKEKRKMINVDKTHQMSLQLDEKREKNPLK